MRKLAFIHDGPLFLDENNNYYEYAYHGLCERYSYLADEITFLTRVKPISSLDRFTQLDSSIKVIEVPNHKDPHKYLKTRHHVEEIVSRCVNENDLFVLRLQSSIAEIAYKYIKELNKPYIVELVSCPWDSYWNHSALGKVVAPYAFLKTRHIVRKSKYIYYVTEEFLQRRYPMQPDAITVSCSNVELKEFDKSVLDFRFKGINSRLSNNKLILGTAAALDTRYKGQEYVIKALSYLQDKGIDVEYRLAGGRNRDPNDRYLEHIADVCGVRDKVVFIGALSSEKMMTFYDDLDIYIQPSKQEGLPRSVIEAMSRGCIVLGSNIAGIPELLHDDCLFKAGNVPAIVNKICEIMSADWFKIAERNYDQACLYKKSILDRRRQLFYNSFLKEYFGENARSI